MTTESRTRFTEEEIAARLTAAAGRTRPSPPADLAERVIARVPPPAHTRSRGRLWLEAGVALAAAAAVLAAVALRRSDTAAADFAPTDARAAATVAAVAPVLPRTGDAADLLGDIEAWIDRPLVRERERLLDDASRVGDFLVDVLPAPTFLVESATAADLGAPDSSGREL